MSAEIILFVPRPNPKREEKKANLERQALEIFAQLGGPLLLTDHVDEPGESA